MGSVFFSRPGVGVEEGSAHVLPQRGLLGLRDKRRRARAFAERRLRPVKGAYVSLKRFFAFKDVISQRSVCQNFESSFQLGCFLARARARRSRFSMWTIHYTTFFVETPENGPSICSTSLPSWLAEEDEIKNKPFSRNLTKMNT